MVDAMEVEAEEAPSTELMIKVIKAKDNLAVNTAKLHDHVYQMALSLGIQVLLNRGQSKITKEAYPNPEKLKAKAMEVAQETLKNIYAGNIRMAGGAKSDKVPREVMTEARRIARNLVKEELKRGGVKVSYVETSEITKVANLLLANDPSIIEQAKAEIEARSKTKVKIDIGKIPLSQKKIKAAEAKKADKVLSAAKTGKIATRGRPSLNT